jgi:chromate transporter
MTDAAPARPVPTLADLFLTYGRIGLIGFGGINAWARRVLVEEKRWLSDQDYAETLGLGQVLPGPNALNAAIMIGDRFHGTAGAIAAPVAMFGGPLVLLAGLAMFYDAYGEVPVVKAVLAGVAAAAAGMVMGTAAKMTQKLKPPPALLAVGLCALLAAGVLRVPLPYVVLGLAPFGIAAAWWALRAR